MLSTTRALCSNKFRYHIKYPYVVSYNKFPWMVLTAGTPAVHEHAAQHYEQVLSLAAAVEVPQLVNKFHPEIPPEKQTRLLPGLLYVLPRAQSGGEAKELAPLGWDNYKKVGDTAALQHYGAVQRTIGDIAEVHMFESPDLRLVCNAVTFKNCARTSVAERSSLAALRGEDGDIKDFTLFHFFRPNRPPAEMSRQLQKYYVHAPCGPDVERFLNPAGWTPRLDAPQRGAAAVVSAPAKFVPPQSYVMGLAERLAVVPGSCFGRRGLMWGTWF